MSQIRMQTQVPGARAEAKLPLDPVLMDEIQQVCAGGGKLLFSYEELMRSPSSSQQEKNYYPVFPVFRTLYDQKGAEEPGNTASGGVLISSTHGKPGHPLICSVCKILLVHITQRLT